jgi:hypothetical protein
MPQQVVVVNPQLKEEVIPAFKGITIKKEERISYIS